MYMQVDEPIEAEGNNQNAATSGDPLPTDGEPASLAEKAKERYKRHKPKIRAVVTLAVGLSLVVAAHRLEWQGSKRRVVEDAGSSEPVSDREAADKSGRSAPYPVRDPFVRKLPAGQQASSTAMESYREREGSDLPAGLTWVSR